MLHIKSKFTVIVLSVLAICGSFFGLPNQAEAAKAADVQNESNWPGGAITNDGWIYLYPNVQIKTWYYPQQARVHVKVSKPTLSVDGDSRNDGDGFWDGYVLTTLNVDNADSPPPMEGSYITPGADSGSTAVSELKAWGNQTGHQVIWGATMSNLNSRDNWYEFGYFSDSGKSEFEYDINVENVAPGSSIPILSIGDRWYHWEGEGDGLKIGYSYVTEINRYSITTPTIAANVFAWAEEGGKITTEDITYRDSTSWGEARRRLR